MAGRGRGQRALSFNVDSMGLTRGEGLPAGLQQPTPVFPVMEQKPLPLTGGEEAEYLLALKQDFRVAMRTLPCFIQPAAAHRDVERYSDKYHSSEQSDDPSDWRPDWKRFPRELRVHVKRPAKDIISVNLEPSKKKVREKEVLLKLETLEKKEEQESSEEEEGGERKKQEEEEEAEAEEYDEEEFEEETDYIMSYFDNGEEFGGESDDNMDEAVY